jgi:hypothetical protein
VYAPRISEDEFMRTAVRQQSAGSTTRPLATGGDGTRVEHVLAYLGTLHGENDQCSDGIALQTIAALLERAETAERAAATWEAKAHNAELQVQATEQRALAAKRRAEKAEQRVETLLQQMNRPPKPQRKQPVPFGTVIEHRNPAGICRVCARKAPPQSAARRDDLRVCVSEACRVEARRRDNVAKQRRARRKRLSRITPPGAITYDTLHPSFHPVGASLRIDCAWRQRLCAPGRAHLHRSRAARPHRLLATEAQMSANLTADQLAAFIRDARSAIAQTVAADAPALRLIVQFTLQPRAGQIVKITTHDGADAATVTRLTDAQHRAQPIYMVIKAKSEQVLE